MKKYKIGFIIVLFFLVSNFVTTNDFSVNQDSLAHLEYIKSYADFFSTGKIEMLKFSSSFGVIGHTLSGLSLFFLNGQFELFNIDSAIHIPIIFFGALIIFVVFIFTNEVFGLKTAVLSSLFLSLIPRFAGHLHNNIKDIPILAFYILSIYLFWKATKKKKIKWFVLAGFVLGLGFTLKTNAFFIPFVILSWIIIINLGNLRKGIKFFHKQFYPKISLKNFTIYLLTAIVTMIIFLPGMWSKNSQQLSGWAESHANFLQGTANWFFGDFYLLGINTPWFYPLLYLLITIPLAIITLAIFGFFITLTKLDTEQKKISVLLFLIFFVTVGKYIFFDIVVYHGTRHFLEVLFPIAVFAGIGGVFLIDWINKKVPVKKAGEIAMGVVLILLLVPIVAIHPYQYVYYNETVQFFGGPQNFEMDYYCTSIKRAMKSINKEAQGDELILVPICPEVAKFYNSRNIEILQFMPVKEIKETNREIFALLLYSPRPHYNERDDMIEFIETEFTPFKTIDSQGIPILKIYKINTEILHN